MTDPPSANTQSKIHESWIDTFRGIAILAVLAIHILPRIFQQLARQSPLWYALITIHRACFFAVPSFLLLSAMVNAHSLLRSSDLRRYARTRAQSVLWPYVVWSLVYVFYQKLDNPTGFHFASILSLLWYGKAFPHLYFMVLLIQLLLLLPIFMPVIRRRPNFASVAVAAVVITIATYLANRLWLRLPSPGSVILWYTPAVALGLYLGTQFEHARDILRRAFPWALAAIILSLFWYAPSAFDQARHLHVRFDGAIYQGSEWLFTTGMSLLVMAAVAGVGEGRLRNLLGYVGRNSLQIYLAHPLFLALLDKHPGFTFALGAKGAILILFATAIAAPLLLSELTRKLRISSALFGRSGCREGHL